jgi:hypothetical protein
MCSLTFSRSCLILDYGEPNENSLAEDSVHSLAGGDGSNGAHCAHNLFR